MRLLLDTHVLIWLMTGGPVTEASAEAARDPDNDVLLSIASLWEIAIKQGRGRLDLPGDAADAARANGVDLLPVTPPHVRAVRDLPHHHRDPFDRMLVAQAQVERLTLVTSDSRLRAYDVDLLEA